MLIKKFEIGNVLARMCDYNRTLEIHENLNSISRQTIMYLDSVTRSVKKPSGCVIFKDWYQ